MVKVFVVFTITPTCGKVRAQELEIVPQTIVSFPSVTEPMHDAI